MNTDHRNKLFISRSIMLGLLVGVLLLVGSGAYALNAIRTYTPALTTQLFDRNGQLLYEIYDTEHRLWVSQSQIPEQLKQATIAIEDERFYQHGGVDPIAIGRAIKSIFIDKEFQGASTITQQYVKNAFLSPERTLDRKIKEAVIASLVEISLDKQEILERYLNEVAYGGVHYGVQAASHYYFNKDVKDITLAQSALLASLTKAPTVLNPQSNLSAAKQRQRIVLDKMYQLGFINQDELQKALEQSLDLTFTQKTFLAPHFSLMIRDQLFGKYGERKVTTGGFRVKTSLDLALQIYAEEAVSSEMQTLSSANVNNAAALVINPETGEILSLVGSKDYYNPSIDGAYNVITASRQPGSSFKPFVYALAFENRYSPGTVLLDTPTTYKTAVGDYQPKNYDGQFHGPVSIRSALANSYNIPATRMLAVLGVRSLVNKAHALGFDYMKAENVGLSLALGGTEVRPLDMAYAYAAFANEGVKPEPLSILSVADRNGETIDTYKPKSGTKVFSSEIAFLISDILADDTARMSTFGPNSVLHTPDTTVAVKTGTTNDRRDNWTIGYTPDFVVTVWVGNSDNSPMSTITSGLSGASPIWRTITDALIKQKGNHWFTKPGGIVEARIDKRTGKKNCGSNHPDKEIYINGTQPTECASMSVERLLVEERGGEEVIISTATESMYEQFNKDPFQFIDEHKDILQADDTPTNVFIKEIGEPVSDPLARLTKSQGNTISLSLLPH